MSQKPVREYREGNMQIAVFENESKNDKVKYLSYTFNKRYQDKESGEWKESKSMFSSDLDRLKLLLERVWFNERVARRDS